MSLCNWCASVTEPGGLCPNCGNRGEDNSPLVDLFNFDDEYTTEEEEDEEWGYEDD